MARLEDHERRLRSILRRSIASPGWSVLWLAGAVFFIGSTLAWRPSERVDPFRHWVRVGADATILVLVALFRWIEIRNPTDPKDHWTTGAGGIDVWMPLTVLTLFLLGFAACCLLVR